MAIYVTFSIEDADEDDAHIVLPFQPDVPVSSADVDDIVLSLWEIVRPLLNGRLKEAKWEQHIDISGVSSNTADVLSDVQEMANFQFKTTDSKTYKVIPTFRESFFLNGGASDKIDTSAAAVVAFVQLMTDGFALGGGNYLRPVSDAGKRVTRLIKATEWWGKRRKR